MHAEENREEVNEMNNIEENHNEKCNNDEKMIMKNNIELSDKMHTTEYIERVGNSLSFDEVGLACDRYEEGVNEAEKKEEEKNEKKNEKKNEEEKEEGKEEENGNDEKEEEKEEEEEGKSNKLPNNTEEVINKNIDSVNRSQFHINIQSSSIEEREKVDTCIRNPIVILEDENKDNNNAKLAPIWTSFDSTKNSDRESVGRKRRITNFVTEIESISKDEAVLCDARLFPRSRLFSTLSFERRESVQGEMRNKNIQNRIFNADVVNDNVLNKTERTIECNVLGMKSSDNYTEMETNGVVQNTEFEKIGILKDNCYHQNISNCFDSLNGTLNNDIVPNRNDEVQHNITAEEISVNSDFHDSHQSKKTKFPSLSDIELDKNEISDAGDEVHGALGGDVCVMGELESNDIDENREVSSNSGITNHLDLSEINGITDATIGNVNIDDNNDDINNNNDDIINNNNDNDDIINKIIDKHYIINKNSDDDGNNDSNDVDDNNKSDNNNYDSNDNDDNNNDDIDNDDNNNNNNDNSTGNDSNENGDENIQKIKNKRKRSTVPQKEKKKIDIYYEKQYEKEMLKDIKERKIITDKMLHASLSMRGNMSNQLFVSIRPPLSPSFSTPSSSSPSSTSTSFSTSSSTSSTICLITDEYVPPESKFQFRLQRYPEEDRLPCLENSFFESISSDKSITVGGIKRFLQNEFSKFNSTKSSSSTHRINPILYGPLNLELILSIVLKNENKKSSSPVYYLNNNFTTLWSVCRLISESNVKCIIEYRSIVPK